MSVATLELPHSGHDTAEKPRRYWLWLTLAVSAFCLLAYGGTPYLTADGDVPTWLPQWIAATQIMSLALCLAIYGFVRLTDRLPGAWGWIAAFAAGAIAAFISAFHAYEWIVWFERDNPAFRPHYVQSVGINLIIDIWMFSFVAAAQKLLRVVEIGRARDARLAEAHLAAGQAQLNALRHQISPHFLFNTLNAISGLIAVRRKAEAKAMMRQLADYVRSSTDANTEELVSLSDELAMIQAYLAIERVRFGRRLAFQINSPAALRDAEVPSFLLQPLVENAVKHAVAPSSDRVTITLDVDDDEGRLILVLDDDGKVRKPARGLGIGLRNIEQRLTLLYGDKASFGTQLRDDGFTAHLAIPLRHRRHIVAANDEQGIALPLHVAAGI